MGTGAGAGRAQPPPSKSRTSWKQDGQGGAGPDHPASAWYVSLTLRRLPQVPESRGYLLTCTTTPGILVFLHATLNSWFDISKTPQNTVIRADPDHAWTRGGNKDELFSVETVDTTISYCGSFSAWLTVQEPGLCVTGTQGMSGDLGVTQGPGTQPEASACASPLPDPPLSSIFQERSVTSHPGPPHDYPSSVPGSVTQEHASSSTTFLRGMTLETLAWHFLGYCSVRGVPGRQSSYALSLGPQP